MTKIRLEPVVNFGRGVMATAVWLPGGPIVLVETQSRAGTLNSRLDVDKERFIDPLPEMEDGDALRQLLKQLPMDALRI